jgi:aerobic carbon-monoxide dehydrogenase large subunit
VRDEQFPFRTHSGQTYDSGRYAHALTTAAEIAEYETRWRARQRAAAASRATTRRIGIGVAAYVEITAGGQMSEYARVEVHADGSATVFAGTASHGQGHQTAYAMLVADQTGIPMDQISVSSTVTPIRFRAAAAPAAHGLCS